LKWRYATEQRASHQNSWRKTIREQRRALNDVIAESPSLKGLPQELLRDGKLYRDDILPDAEDETGSKVSPRPAPGIRTQSCAAISGRNRSGFVAYGFIAACMSS
jgi:hypothetical protein